MAVLVFIDQSEGHIKKVSLETLSYGAKVAALLNTEAAGIVVGKMNDDLPGLGKYGVKTIYQVAPDHTEPFDSQVYTTIIAEAVQATGSTVVIFSHNQHGRAVAPRLSARLKAGLVAGAAALPDTANGFVVKKTVFSGKAFAYVAVNTPIKIISLSPNAYTIQTGEGTATVKPLDVKINPSKIKVTAVNKATGDVSLSEADLVISGGRGLKGPENWGMIEELAKLLGAATACSRPVADAHWRPHHEHVGQTGLAIAPNLYFAVGISGAIQHLAGVNRSKVIVVINKDPEAPFFKAADYGIVGDAFEVMPKIIAAVKQLKGVA